MFGYAKGGDGGNGANGGGGGMGAGGALFVNNGNVKLSGVGFGSSSVAGGGDGGDTYRASGFLAGGGGGGASDAGGSGGFGGGEGGGFFQDGSPGYGGGASSEGTTSAGGGGAALGGAIFIRNANGASVEFGDGSVAEGTVTAGKGGTAAGITSTPTGDGLAQGSSMFLMSGTTTFNTPYLAQISGGIASQLDIELLKTGEGILILAGENTYTGTTRVSAGTLQIGNGDLSGSIATNIRNDALVSFYRSDSYTYGGVISGSGAVEVNWGNITLTGDHSYTGLTKVTLGTFSIGNGGTTGSISGDIEDRATLGSSTGPTIFSTGES